MRDNNRKLEMDSKTRDFTQGGQVIKYMIKMFVQIINVISYWAFIFGLLAVVLYLVFVPKWIYIKHGALYYYIKEIVTRFDSFNPDLMKTTYEFEWVNKSGVHTISRTYAQILDDKYFQQCGHILLEHTLWATGIFLVVFFGIIIGASLFLRREGSEQRKNNQIGGRYLAKSIKEVNSILKSREQLSPFKIGELHLVKDSEIQNIAVHGSVGTGKSTTFNDLLVTARSLNQRALIYDRGGNFIPMFYRKGKDIILNPMDARCPNWDLWEECKDKIDLENFAIPLLPENEGKGDPFWILSARNLFVSTAEAMRKDKDRSLRKLLNALLSIPLSELRDYLENTDASSLVEGSIEKTAITIRTVLGSYARALRCCQGLDKQGGEKFSVSQWIRNADQDAWIFLSSDGRVHESIKPLLTAWLNVAMQNVLALKPDLNRRIWTILDELNSLHNLPMILEYLSEARKFGGASVLGLQNFAQLENNYGDKKARAIWDLINTVAYFRAPSGEIAKWVQKEIGEIRHLKFKDQYSYGVDTIRDGVNFAKEETSEPIVSYSDLQSLNDLECYVSLKGDMPVVKVKLERKNYPLHCEGRIERDLSGVFDSELDKKIDESSQSAKADEIAERILKAQNSGNAASQGGSEVLLEQQDAQNAIDLASVTLQEQEKDIAGDNQEQKRDKSFDEHREANTNSVKRTTIDLDSVGGL